MEQCNGKETDTDFVLKNKNISPPATKSRKQKKKAEKTSPNRRDVKDSGHYYRFPEGHSLQHQKIDGGKASLVALSSANNP